MEDRWELSAEQTPGFGPIAERFRRAGELDKAVSLCREGLSKFPNHLSGRVTLGWSLLELGRYDEARVELERVIKRAPDNLAAIRGLAELHDRAEHDAVFAPAEAPVAWPPKPAVTEAGNGWLDPDQVVTEAAKVVSSKRVDEPELIDEELPALLAELEPVAPERDAAENVIAAAPAAVSDITVQAVNADAVSKHASTDESESGLVLLHAAMAELDAATADVSASATEPPAQPVVAEFAVETTSLDEVLSDLALAEAAPVAATARDANVEPISPAAELSDAALVMEPANVLADVAPEPVADQIVELTSELLSDNADALPVPTVDLLEDAADSAAAAPAVFEADAVVLADEPTVELAVDDAVEELFEAAEIAELTAQVEEPILHLDESRLAPAASIATAEQPIELDVSSPDLDLDLPLDPALFELARGASADHAAPAIERTDDVFDLETEPHFEIATIEQSHDYHEPELALRSPASGADASSDRNRALHDLSLDAPGLTPAAELPQPEYQPSERVATSGTARDVQLERAFDLSDDFASAMRGGADFASPQVTHAEAVEAEAPVVVSGFTPPVADTQWSEPEQPSPALAESDLEPTPVLETAAKAAPDSRRKRRTEKAPELPKPQLEEPVVVETPTAAQAAVPQPAAPPAEKRVVKPVNGLERFLHRIERRKATLASDSAA